MFRILVVTIVGTFAGAISQIFLRRGMQAVGPLETYAPLELLAYFGRVVVQPYVIVGTLLSMVLYLSLLVVLSWTGVTVAFPLTALEYGFAAVLAVLVLKEAVPPMRWAGISLVVLGVILISAGGEGENSDQAAEAVPQAEQGGSLDSQ